jgi:hypothetical protein
MLVHAAHVARAVSGTIAKKNLVSSRLESVNMLTILIESGSTLRIL